LSLKRLKCKQWPLNSKFFECKFCKCCQYSRTHLRRVSCWCCDLPDSPTFAKPCCADSPTLAKGHFSIFEKNVTRLDKFARVPRDSRKFGASGHSLLKCQQFDIKSLLSRINLTDKVTYSCWKAWNDHFLKSFFFSDFNPLPLFACTHDLSEVHLHRMCIWINRW
jgi:hypothetical protein